MKVSSMLRMSAALGLATLLLGSCTSLPLPNTPDKSLLVISSNITRRIPAQGPETMAIALRLTNTASAKQIVFPISFDTDLNYIAIEPGSYSISSLVVTRAWVDHGQTYSSWEDNHYAGSRLLIEPKTVSLYPSPLTYTDTTDPNHYDVDMWNVRSTDEERAKILETMKKDPHWLAWEGYMLVNFPEQ
jgi:hypothetical protein